MATSASPSSCVFCGDAPVNHTLHFINTCIDLFFGRVFPGPMIIALRMDHVDQFPPVRFISRYLIELLVLLRVLRFSDDISKVCSERTRVIWEEAKRRGIRMEQLYVFGMPRDDMRAMLPSRKGSKKLRWEYFQSIPIPPWLNHTVEPWVDDKQSFKKRFKKKGFPVANGKAVTTIDEALRVFQKLSKPVITKPREGSRARHTTVGIRTEEELREGFRRAKQLCPFVMVEEFATGILYRATCINGRLIGVVEFVKPATVADGVHTAEELRVLHNQHKKFPTLTDVKADAWFYDAIQHQGYAPDSIPPKGAKLLLSEHSERPNGGYFVDITDRIPKSTQDMIERASVECEVETLGFDIISEDLTDPSVRFTFIEGNSLPYIELHHIPFEGKPRDTAGAVWDMWGL